MFNVAANLALPQWGQQVGQNIRQNRLEAKQDEQRNLLAEALPKAVAGDMNALARVYQADPNVGFQIDSKLSEAKRTEQKLTREQFDKGLGEFALTVANDPDKATNYGSHRQRFIDRYSQINPELGSMLTSQLPEAWSPELEPEFNSFAGIKPEKEKAPPKESYQNPDGTINTDLYEAAKGLKTASTQLRIENPTAANLGNSPSGYESDGDGGLRPIRGGPYDPSARKGPTGGPVPITAQKAMRESREALRAAESMEKTLAEGRSLLTGKNPDGTDRTPIETGPVDRIIAAARNKADMGSENSRGLLALKQKREKLRSDYLMLAKGVQTEGDAIRAMDAMMPDTNDPEAIIMQFDALQRASQQLQDMHRESLNSFESEYGREPTTQQPAAQTENAKTSGMIRVKSAAEAMALPPGTRFVTPDGRVKVR